MHDSNLSDTQPSQPKAGDTQPLKTHRGTDRPRQSKQKRIWLWLLVFILGLATTTVLGALAGYQSAQATQKKQALLQSEGALSEQFELGLLDLAEGRYEVAAQRFEYIISVDPGYPGAPEKLAEAAAVLYSTATPTALPPTVTPTPTRDPRPIEELFNQALAHSQAQEWDQTIETLLALRKEDLAYQTARVDGLLYLSLRNRGVDKILKQGNLQGGVYDLALAGAFGPIDVEANQARDWARFYMIGLSFWEVYPEQAVYYFSQVAAMAPYLSDASGWTATDRYRAALIQYGDQLASQEAWCEAQVQYELALNIRGDETLQANWQISAERCLLTTVTATLPASGTPTATGTPGATLSPTTSATTGPSATPTATLPLATTQPAGATATPIPSPTPTATFTQGAPQATATAYPGPVQSNLFGASARPGFNSLWQQLLNYLLVYNNRYIIRAGL